MSTRETPGGARGIRERAYASLLRILPREFRERFGEELLSTAREMDRDDHPMIGSASPFDGLRDLRACLRALGDLTLTAWHLHREQSNDERITMDNMLDDLRFVSRGLWRDRGFTLFVVITLALGLGANLAMFGIADRLLLSGPDHVVRSNEIVRLYQTFTRPGQAPLTESIVGAVSYEMLRSSTAFSDVAAYMNGAAFLGEGVDSQEGRVEYVTENYFALLGVQPLRGRTIAADENRYGAADRVAVIGYGAWQQMFGGVQDILGRTASINNEPYTIIGVAPRGFTGAELAPVDVWLPSNLVTVVADQRTSWNAQWLRVIGRLAPGATVERAGLEATGLHRNAYTGTDTAVATATLSFAPLSTNMSGEAPLENRVVRWLGGVSLLVLLIACANIANLLLARGMRRSRELAIRAAMGAGRRRIVSLLVTESALLSLGGALAGIAVALALANVAQATLFSDVDWSAPMLNSRLLGVAVVLMVATTVLVGLVPALRASRTDVSSALRAGVREGGGQRQVTRRVLTVAQAALSVLLLIGAGLFLRSLWNVRTLNMGFDASRVITVAGYRTPLSRLPEQSRTAERARRAAFNMRAAEELRELPAVADAAIAVGLPFSNRFSLRTRIAGVDTSLRISTGGPSISAVSSRYFTVMGTRILDGRGFTEADRGGSMPVAIVSAEMARVGWPGRSPLGECVYVGGSEPPCHVIVGIAADARRSELREEPVLHYYVPLGQEQGISGATILVRGEGNATAVAEAVRRKMFEMDASITQVRTTTLQELIDPQAKPWRLGAIVFAFAGALALLVAAVGIYSVMSYLVTNRRHEFGVRLALGAVTRDLVALVLRGSFAVAVIGVVIGEGVALLLGRFAEPLLFDVSPRDPLVYSSVAVTLIIVALVATLVPAWRTRRLEPMDALRAE